MAVSDKTREWFERTYGYSFDEAHEMIDHKLPVSQVDLDNDRLISRLSMKTGRIIE